MLFMLQAADTCIEFFKFSKTSASITIYKFEHLFYNVFVNFDKEVIVLLPVFTCLNQFHN